MTPDLGKATGLRLCAVVLVLVLVTTTHLAAFGPSRVLVDVDEVDTGGQTDEALVHNREEEIRDEYDAEMGAVGDPDDLVLAANNSTTSAFANAILDDSLDCSALSRKPEGYRNKHHLKHGEEESIYVCAKTERRGALWFFAAPPGNREMCLWFNHFRCAFDSCSTWEYFQLSYVQNELYTHDEGTHNAIDALAALKGDYHRGVQKRKVDFRDIHDTAPVHKRPHRYDLEAYKEYVDQKLEQIARRPKANPADAASKPIPRKLWMLWLQGREHISTYSKLNAAAVDAWFDFHPDWEVTLIDNTTLAKYAPLTAESWSRKPKGRELSHLADLMRLELICRYGGVWADASLMPMYRLDDWVDDELAKPGRTFVQFHFTTTRS